ncbi:hypothetical protein HED60_05780 [Planctomycetales bacterium ZRK34]|nr:hypothetical protein HED60_05780 [Planctomycetales bacterium ZRK34]
MRRTPRSFIAAILVLTMTATAAWAQQQPVDLSKYVSREEYETLKRELADMKDNLKKVQQQTSGPNKETEEYLAFIDQELTKVKQLADANRAGTTNFLITGYATAGYTDRQGEPSTFSATFTPLFLWELSDRLLFEAELEFELEAGEMEGSETHIELEYADISYAVNDYVTIGAGKFLTPFNIFSERLHPAWINKLPDMPLPFGHGGLAPMASLGAYVRGGYPIGDSMRGNYAFYVSNGPMIVAEEEHEVGMLMFDNPEDSDNNKAVGGRVGFLPVPGLEVGYSFQVSRPNVEDIGQLDALLQGVDFSYVHEYDAIGGIIDVRFEWVWSDVEDATYDPDGSLGFGPVTFDNERDGWYAQMAYRPSQHNSEIIKNLEFVFRYDEVNNPDDAPESFDRNRYTFGLNYWIGPSTVIKTAYQIDNREGGESEDANAFLIQAAMGF